MKTLAAIKNELFNDYLKIVSTDNLEATLDNPAVPVPFVCVASVENNNADSLANEINTFFAHRKIKNKDFLAVDENDISQLKFLFNLIQLSSSGAGISSVVQPVVEEQPKTDNEVKKTKKVEKLKEETAVSEEKIIQKEVQPEETAAEATQQVAQNEVEEIGNPFDEPETETVEEVEPVAEEQEETLEAITSEEVELIESLNIPKKSVINFAKDESITALIVDEKTVIYEEVEMAIIEATKKAFKKAGATGLPLGLSNWNYNGENLKNLKDKK